MICIVKIFLVVIITVLSASSAQHQDPRSYEQISLPLPDTLDQLYRDSATIQIGRVRVNQAGYRPQDNKYFYYVASQGSSPSQFSVIEYNSGDMVATGQLIPRNTEVAGQMRIRASNNAQITTGGDTRYEMESELVEGALYEGMIPESVGPGRYIIRVGTDESVPFRIDERIYSWVRDAAIKFPGVNRCGDSDSWFHPACHLQDPTPGGWHDCGDHLKEGITQSFLHAMLGLAAAVFRDRDVDNYGRNHNHTINTDGIPDVLYEAKHGADYILTAYDNAGGEITSMVTSVADYGQDHQWWGRPEFQDMMPQDRGGPPRAARIELGANILGNFASGLAFTGKLYEPFDSEYAEKCIRVAEELYAYAKENQEATETPAYNGNGTVNDELALAAVALMWATGNRVYLEELCYDQTIGTHGNAVFDNFSFEGGWFANNNVQFSKDMANTDWASVHVPAKWGFFRLILLDEELCEQLGITSEERLRLIERTMNQMIYSISQISHTGDASIELPNHGLPWGGHILRYNSVWKYMHIQQDWMWNRYQFGNIFDLYCYSDMAKWVQGLELPNTPASTDWKGPEVREVMVRQMDYMLGVNPWDVSMILGVGNKNFNHIHHRAANPEGKNVPGAFYPYRPPVGALWPGVNPTEILHDEHYDNYYVTESGIDASAVMMVPIMGLAKDEPINEPPDATVRIVHVGYDQAIIEIRQSRFGNSTVRYGEITASPSQLKECDSAGVFHRIVLDGLRNGTTYHFDVLVSDLFGNSDAIDNRGEYFEFTTLQNRPGDAEIINVKVCKVTSDSAEIFWYTPNGEYNSRIVFGKDMPPDIVQDGNIYDRPTSFHYVKIGGLEERTTYYFYVESDGVRDDNDGQFYSFTTPVEHVEFDVRAIRYDEHFIGLNVVNQDVKAYDSLELRMYVRSPEIINVDGQEVNFDDHFAFRVDIGIQYNSAGYQDEHFKEYLDPLVQAARPVKMDDTYDPETDTWAWYIPVPLGSAQMESGARFRIDLLMDSRSPWPPYEDLMNVPPQKEITDLDWSFKPHSRADGAPFDYPGLPEGEKDEDLDQNYWNIPVNPYITVYRKNEFVWGYSPSRSEQQTRQNHYELTSQIVDPLLNPSDEYVFIEQVNPVVTARGWARVNEDGVINDIWVNGERIVDVSSVARYDFQQDMYELAIPVPVQNGPNNVDVTIFAGPPEDCIDCMGCAFQNHSFYVDFRGAEAYPSSMSLRDLQDNPLGDTARIDTTVFNVLVRDLNANLDPSKPDTVWVSVVNPVNGDSIYIPLLETGDSTGNFRSIDPVEVVSLPPSQRGKNQISMRGGDVIWVTYIDPTDPTDISQAYLVSRADFPVPVDAWFTDTGGEGTIDRIVIRFNQVIDDPLDSIRLTIPDMEGRRLLTPSQDNFTIEEDVVYIDLNPELDRITGFEPGAQMTARTYLTYNEIVRESVVPVADRAGPILLDRALLFERVTGVYDTLQLLFSEPINPQKTVHQSLYLKQGNEIIPLTVLTILNSGTLNNSVTLLVYADGGAVKEEDYVFINPEGPIRDYAGNHAHPENTPVPVILRSALPRITSAHYFDSSADGVIDNVKFSLSSKVDVTDLSIEILWEMEDTVKIPAERISLFGDSGQDFFINIEGLVTGDSIITGGQMYMYAAFRNFSNDRLERAVNDSAAPVIKNATFAPGAVLEVGESYPDTLYVTFSESVAAIREPQPFTAVYGETGQQYTFNLHSITNQTSEQHVFIVNSIDGVEYPGTLDSIWIDTATQVYDSYLNVQTNENNRRSPLTVKPPPFTMKFSAGPNPFVFGETESIRLEAEPISLIPIEINLSGEVYIYDNVGNLVINEPLQKEDGSSKLYFDWNGYTSRGRKAGTGSYLAIIRVEGDTKSPEPDRGRITIGISD
ncbi:glycoside hydrolase family 9 protein [Chitinispirillales bacterium ANBcel5]|uniref:glycoside hydrolase family 9 protein n=1 Tax=Cellulosispirillum alkaliphilum TaxID=3039283 RepID=UPI002A52BCBC|nr:glycoside hydrolase family 9 protein [Chitinispirillales bacterium ANBcel5]